MAKARRSYRKRTARKVRKGGRRTRRQNRRKVGGMFGITSSYKPPPGPIVSQATKDLDWVNGFKATRTAKGLLTVYNATYTPTESGAALTLDFIKLNPLVQLMAKTKTLEAFNNIGINLNNNTGAYLTLVEGAVSGWLAGASGGRMASNQYLSTKNFVSFNFEMKNGALKLVSVDFSTKDPVSKAITLKTSITENSPEISDPSKFNNGYERIVSDYEKMNVAGELIIA
jgi:hypothetical protein